MMINQLSKEIEEKVQNTYKGFLKSLKEDQLRVTRCELRIKKVEEMKEKVEVMDQTITQLHEM